MFYRTTPFKQKQTKNIIHRIHKHFYLPRTMWAYLIFYLASGQHICSADSNLLCDENINIKNETSSTGLEQVWDSFPPSGEILERWLGDPDCENGAYADYWEVVRYNVSHVKFNSQDVVGDYEKYMQRAPWSHGTSPEQMTCPLGAIVLRLAEVSVGLESYETKKLFLNFEFIMLFHIFPVSVWLRSKWGALLGSQLAVVLGLLCEESHGYDWCAENIMYDHNLYEGIVDTHFIDPTDGSRLNELELVTVTAPNYLEIGESATATDEGGVLSVTELVALVSAVNWLVIAMQQPERLKIDDREADNAFLDATDLAWQVFDMSQSKMFNLVDQRARKVLDDGFKINFVADDFQFVKVWTSVIDKFYTDMRGPLPNWRFEPTSPNVFNPELAREKGDHTYLPIRQCEVSNTVYGEGHIYWINIFAASVHKNSAVDSAFSVMNFAVWSGATAHDVAYMKQGGYNSNQFICESFVAYWHKHLTLVCESELPSGEVFKSYATSVDAVTWVRAYRSAFECVIPEGARQVKVYEAMGLWDDQLVVNLCDYEHVNRKFENAICLRELYHMNDKFHSLLEDWLHYHLSMGFEHVYLYDHDSTAASPFIDELVQMGKVSYTLGIEESFPDPHRAMKALQLHSGAPLCQAVELNHCLFQNRAESDWLFFVRGIDKYVTSEHGPNTLTHFMETWHPMRDSIGVIVMGARNYREDDEDVDASQPVFLRKRKLSSYDPWWCPIVTPHVHYIVTPGARPRDGYKMIDDVDQEDIRVNHYQNAFGKLGNWRETWQDEEHGITNTSDEDAFFEPWMDWGQKWIADCRARKTTCPYLDVSV